MFLISILYIKHVFYDNKTNDLSKPYLWRSKHHTMNWQVAVQNTYFTIQKITNFNKTVRQKVYCNCVLSRPFVPPPPPRPTCLQSTVKRMFPGLIIFPRKHSIQQKCNFISQLSIRYRERYYKTKWQPVGAYYRFMTGKRYSCVASKYKNRRIKLSFMSGRFIEGRKFKGYQSISSSW